MNIDDLLAAAKETIDKQAYCFAENLDANARLIQATKVRDDWTVRFFTEQRCRKFREIERSRRLTLAYQHDPDRAYVTLAGHPKIIEDVATKRAMWALKVTKFIWAALTIQILSLLNWWSSSLKSIAAFGISHRHLAVLASPCLRVMAPADNIPQLDARKNVHVSVGSN